MAGVDEQTLQQLAGVYRQTFSAVEADRKHSEEQLASFQSQQGFLTAMFQLLMRQDFPVEVRLAAAIGFKNSVRTRYSDPSIEDNDRVFIRSHIVEALVRADDRRIRSQICIVMQYLASDFPDKWPSLADEITRCLKFEDFHTIRGGLLALRYLLKISEYDPKNKSRIFAFIDAMFPLMLPLARNLCERNTEEGYELVKLICKCFWSATHFAIPPLLLNQINLEAWLGLFGTILQQPPPADLTVNPEQLPQTMVWKTKKWVSQIVLRIFQRYGNSKYSNGADEKQISREFNKRYSGRFLELFLDIMLQNRQGTYVAPRVQTNAVNYIGTAVGLKSTYEKLKPHLETLVVTIIFPLLCVDAEDEALWREDPVEYVHKTFDLMVEIYSSRSSALHVLESLLAKRPKESIPLVLQYSAKVLSDFAQSVPESRNYPMKDAVFQAIGWGVDNLMKVQDFRNHFEVLVRQHVLPEFASPVGYLRARACWMISQIRKHLSEELVLLATQNCLQCLGDQDLPVRVQAALAMGFLVKLPNVAMAIKPHVTAVIHGLLQICREVDNAEVFSALRELVEQLGEEIIPQAYGIAAELSQAFVRLVKDSDEDAGMNALEVVSALAALVEAMSTKREILSQFENILSPVFQVGLEPEAEDVYEDVLDLLTTYTFYVPQITPPMWAHFHSMHRIPADCGLEYVRNMISPIDNYISRSTELYMADPRNLELTINLVSKLTEEGPDLLDEDVHHASQIMDIVLQWCRGRVDNLVPSFLDHALRLLNKRENPAVRLVLLETIMQIIMYNAEMGVGLLEQRGVTSTFLSGTMDFLDSFRRIYDKKLCVIAFVTLLRLPNPPQSVSSRAALLLQTCISLINELEQMREETTAGKEAAEDNPFADAEEFETLLNNMQGQGEDDDGAASDSGPDVGDDDDDDDGGIRAWGEALLGEQEFTLKSLKDDDAVVTVIDDLDEAVMCADTLIEMSRTQQGQYEALVGALPVEYRNALPQLMQVAERRRS